MLHGVVFGKHVADEPFQFFIPADFHEFFKQSGAETAIVPLIADQESALRLVHPVQSRQAAHSENLPFAAMVRLVLYYESDLAIIVIETDSGEPLVSNALRQFQSCKIT